MSVMAESSLDSRTCLEKSLSVVLLSDFSISNNALYSTPRFLYMFIGQLSFPQIIKNLFPVMVEFGSVQKILKAKEMK